MIEPDIASSTPNPAARSSHSGYRDSFEIHFWGVRGSIPTPGNETVRYGGNTACLEVIAGQHRLIFDGGTGLSALGRHLTHKEPQVSAHIFFTHTQWDRIQGFPFFLPAFEHHNTFQIYGATALNGASIKQCLTDQMLRPNFITPLQRMRAGLEFHNISAGSIIEIDDVLVETIGLNPRTNALGYRISWQDHSLVYATDTDYTQESIDPNLQYLAAEADVLVFDGTYADSEYHTPAGQQAMPWQLGVDIAKAAKVGELVMFHHNPCHSDDYLDHLEQEIRSCFPRVRLAKEGMVLKLA